MSFHREWFKEYTTIENGPYVYLGDNSCHIISGKGTILLHSRITRDVSDVLHVPGLTMNLISVSQATKSRYTFIFSPTSCVLRGPDSTQNLIITCPLEGDLYRLGTTALSILPTHENLDPLCLSLGIPNHQVLSAIKPLASKIRPFRPL